MSFKNNNDDKVIILTTTVHVQENVASIFQIKPIDRINSYIKAIKAWLDHSNFYIVVVDNSNYSFQD